MSTNLDSATDLAKTCGPVVLLGSLSLILVGTAWAQTEKYFTRYGHSDKLWRQLFVVTFNVFLAAFTGCIIATLWQIGVDQDYSQQLVNVPWRYAWTNSFTYFVICTIILFYIWRLYLLSGWIIYCGVLALATVGMTLMYFVSVMLSAAGADIHAVAGLSGDNRFEVSTSWAAVALYMLFVIDFLLVAGIVFQILSRRATAPTTANPAIRRLSLWTIFHCVVFGILSLVTIILEAASQDTFWARSFFYIRAPVLSVGCLHTMNIKGLLLADWRELNTTRIRFSPESSNDSSGYASAEKMPGVEVSSSTITRIEEGAGAAPQPQRFAMTQEKYETLANF